MFSFESVTTDSILSHGWILAASVVSMNKSRSLKSKMVSVPDGFDRDSWVHGFLFSPIPTALQSPDGEYSHVNEAFAVLLGYSRDELEGMDFKLVTHPEDFDTTMSMIARLSSEQDRFTMQKRYITKFQDVIKVHLYVQGVYDDKGVLKYLYTHVMPIEIKEILSTKEHGSSVAKMWIMEQLKSKWLTIAIIVLSAVSAIVAWWVDYNQMRWEQHNLIQRIEQLTKEKPPAK